MKSILQLENVSEDNNVFRTIFKTKHGRIVYLSLATDNDYCTIIDCYYADRMQVNSESQHCSSRPKMLKSKLFPDDKLLNVISEELDKTFSRVEFVTNESSTLTQAEYIDNWKKSVDHPCRFLILVGDGRTYNGLPSRLRTRLKNKLHRSVYIELAFYKDDKGVVKQCCYYDRKYKRKGVKITPPMLLKCFFPYTKEGIIELINSELCCDFSHILISGDTDIDIDNNTTPLCGYIYGR